jgi:RNA polymerase sigma-70 factor (ECF subfamily)
MEQEKNLRERKSVQFAVSMPARPCARIVEGKRVKGICGPNTPAGLDSDEAHLVQRLRNGDPEAMNEIVSRHHSALLRHARTVVSDHGLGEDAVQETWLGVLRGIHSFEGRSSLKTWLFSILHNQAKSLLKRRRRTVSLTPEMMSAIEGAGMNRDREQSKGIIDKSHPLFSRLRGNQETALISQESLQILQDAIDLLPARQRNVMKLRFQGYSARSVSVSLGITEGNQRVLLHRARLALEAVLEDRATMGFLRFSGNPSKPFPNPLRLTAVTQVQPKRQTL